MCRYGGHKKGCLMEMYFLKKRDSGDFSCMILTCFCRKFRVLVAELTHIWP